MQAFGLWDQSQDWHEIIQSNGTREKVNILYDMLERAIDSCFPLVKSKLHTNDKPWLTDRIKTLISKRQTAFASNNHVLWRKLRNQVKREIQNAKLSFHANRIRNLQKNRA
jgi:hypothetical protein